MPPARINAGGQEADDKRASKRLLPCLPDPSADFPAVRWIHKDLARPWLPQAVLLFGKESGALGIFCSRARVKREASIDRREFIEQHLWRWPFRSGARKMHVLRPVPDHGRFPSETAAASSERRNTHTLRFVPVPSGYAPLIPRLASARRYRRFTDKNAAASLAETKGSKEVP